MHPRFATASRVPAGVFERVRLRRFPNLLRAGLCLALLACPLTVFLPAMPHSLICDVSAASGCSVGECAWAYVVPYAA
ncbi:hypothetical protein EDF71_13010 [Comamonas sp. JUb58]|nr:hypothetical protein EDF71_13010 [Comamonas sp. JUb58]